MSTSSMPTQPPLPPTPPTHQPTHATPSLRRRLSSETKPSWKTTELVIYLLAVLGVLIASAVVDADEDGQWFTAQRAWTLVTYLTIGYLISRGLAKSGSREFYDETSGGSSNPLDKLRG